MSDVALFGFEKHGIKEREDSVPSRQEISTSGGCAEARHLLIQGDPDGTNDNNKA
jgi:hypothetical protein